MIRKKGSQWCIYSKDGKELECKSSKSAAEKRLRQIEYFKHNGDSSMIRVNIKTQVNNKKIRKEKRNGREVIIVPSATLPDDVIMNGGLYPAEEIEKSYTGLERTPAPLGHPEVNGVFISAREPEALNGFWVGAHNENVRRENGRVFMDKIIDVETANTTDRGRKLLDAINEEKPIHTSTGIFLEPEMVDNEDSDYEWIARNMEFDHDAILMDSEGAATPEQGVGMFVNQQVTVINSELTDMLNTDVEYATMNLVDAVQRAENASRMSAFKDKIANFVKELMGSSETPMSVNQDENEVDPMITQEMFDKLKSQVADIATNQQAFLDKLNGEIKDMVSNQVKEATSGVEDLTNQVKDLKANIESQTEAERTELVKTVVNAGVLGEETAKGLSVEALREMATNVSKPGSVDNLFGAMNQGGKDEDEFSDELPGEEA